MSEGLDTVHEIIPEGESTAKWAFRTPGFMGSIKQILHCARCGEPWRKGPHGTMRIRDMCKPTSHILCDDCYGSLPD